MIKSHQPLFTLTVVTLLSAAHDPLLVACELLWTPTTGHAFPKCYGSQQDWQKLAAFPSLISLLWFVVILRFFVYVVCNHVTHVDHSAFHCQWFSPCLQAQLAWKGLYGQIRDGHELVLFLGRLTGVFDVTSLLSKRRSCRWFHRGHRGRVALHDGSCSTLCFQRWIILQLGQRQQRCNMQR